MQNMYKYMFFLHVNVIKIWDKPNFFPKIDPLFVCTYSFL